MDKESKQLAKLNLKDKEAAVRILKQIRGLNFKGLSIKKLKGFKNFYRARKGKIRVVYIFDGKTFVVLKVGTRNEKTYKNL